MVPVAEGIGRNTLKRKAIPLVSVSRAFASSTGIRSIPFVVDVFLERNAAGKNGQPVAKFPP